MCNKIKMRGVIEMKKLIQLLAIVVLSGLTLGTREIFAQANDVGTIKYEHLSLQNVPLKKHKEIVQAAPSGLADGTNHTYQLIYTPLKKNETQISALSDDGLTAKKLPQIHSSGILQASEAKYLPQTNELKENYWLVIGMAILIFSILGLLVVRKHYRKYFILVIIGSSVASISPNHTEAASDRLRDDVIQTLADGEKLSYLPPTIDGFAYFGYLHIPTESQKPVDTIEQGKITVYYQSEDNENLTDPITLSGKIGDVYKAEEKLFEGYELLKVDGSATGTFSKTPQSVVYLYQKIQKSTITVYHKDESGTDLQNPEIIEGKVGENYQTSSLSLPNYDLVDIIGVPTGIFGPNNQEVTYRYEQKKGTVRVRYLDMLTGEPVAKDNSISGKLGTSYNVQPDEIDGFVFKNTKGDSAGMFTEDPHEVIFEYNALGTVKVTFKQRIIHWGDTYERPAPYTVQEPSGRYYPAGVRLTSSGVWGSVVTGGEITDMINNGITFTGERDEPVVELDTLIEKYNGQLSNGREFNYIFWDNSGTWSGDIGDTLPRTPTPFEKNEFKLGIFTEKDYGSSYEFPDTYTGTYQKGTQEIVLILTEMIYG